MPAVLIETAFISNPGDVRLLSDPTFLQNIAAGIAAGVKAYAGAVPPPAAIPTNDARRLCSASTTPDSAG